MRCCSALGITPAMRGRVGPWNHAFGTAGSVSWQGALRPRGLSQNRATGVPVAQLN